ncbi:MAG: type I 3-dehydroquinate dehydratase [Proteobacteria bacterium]|nr:type I 3-dehydroquinate dehydratase [Pseudomonadota bacterium]
MKNLLKSGPAPHITGVIMGSVDGAALRRAVAAGAGGVELRADTLKGLTNPGMVKVAQRLRRLKVLENLPIILTLRSRKEGGEHELSDTKRVELFGLLAPFADIIDIELSSKIVGTVVKTARSHGSQVIISYHNFKTTPSAARLNEIITKARAKGADIVKIATTARGTKDLKILTGLLLENKDLIVIAMGTYGAGSRLFFPLLGSMTTYGSITESSAPGQMPVADITAQFKLYGL